MPARLVGPKVDGAGAWACAGTAKSAGTMIDLGISDDDADQLDYNATDDEESEALRNPPKAPVEVRNSPQVSPSLSSRAATMVSMSAARALLPSVFSWACPKFRACPILSIASKSLIKTLVSYIIL